jgi:hypothetical protein
VRRSSLSRCSRPGGRTSVLGALRGFLTHRRLPLIAAVLGLVFASQALCRGWGFEDDVLQRATLLSAPLGEVAAKLYTFVTPATNQEMTDLGAMPWWSLDEVRVIFFRPVAALCVWLDYQLWPDSVLLMHAHSLLWYGALCFVVAVLYRRVQGSSLSTGLAAALFALSVWHVNCVISVAGRGLLQAALLGVLALLFHDRWRRDGWMWGAVLGPLCMVGSLLSGEAGVGILAYLIAYALTIDQASWPKRLATLVPYLALVGVWRLATTAMGYGAWGSGFYIDPGREPLRFVSVAAESSPVLLLSQWLLPEPGLYATLSTWGRRLLWVGGVVFALALAGALASSLRRSRSARFWCVGMVLALAPVCATALPSGRHLLLTGLGAIALMGQFISARLLEPADGEGRRASRIAAAGLLALHGLVYPISVSAGRMLGEGMLDKVVEIGPLPAAEDQDVVLVTMPSPGHMIYLYPYREFSGQTLPAHTRVLAPAHHDLELARLDERTLEISPLHGFLLPPGQAVGTWRDLLPPLHASFACQHGDLFFRDAAFPVAAGYHVELTGMRAEVVALTEDGRPATARFRFDVPLDDESLVWLRWDWETYSYTALAVPEVGESVVIPGPF